MLKSFFICHDRSVYFFSSTSRRTRCGDRNGTPILQSQVNAAMGKKGSQRAALDKIIDDMLTDKAIKEIRRKSKPSGSKPYRRRYCGKNGLTYGSILRCIGLSRHFLQMRLNNKSLVKC